MKKWLMVLAALAFIVFGTSGASVAQETYLFEYAFNIDGAITDTLQDRTSPPPAPPVIPNVDLSAFNTTTGLGTIGVTVGAGNHYVGLFLDHEIDEAINSYFNEIGSPVGSPAGGQSWEIDEPGYFFGDIYANFTAGTLGNSIGTALPEDVSMALAWNFIVPAGETTTVYFRTWQSGTSVNFSSDFGTPSEFYLQQTDPNSSAGGDGKVPEPATLLLLGSGLVGLYGARRKFKK